MSARRPTRPDLAIADVRLTWTPKRGDRVRRVTHTSHTAITQGTAQVLDVLLDRGAVCVAVDMGRNAPPNSDSRWVNWPIAQIRLATDPVHEQAASAHMDSAPADFTDPSNQE